MGADNLLKLKMELHFKSRTANHIDNVNKYLQKIADLHLPEIDGELLFLDKHDESKYKEPEYTPYLYITWKYKMGREGVTYNPPEGMEKAMQMATFHHVKYNKHHPEYWDDAVTPEYINPNNRDKPSVEPPSPKGEGFLI